jgi:glycosyltransferase involved in cell wall biosynthesis
VKNLILIPDMPENNLPVFSIITPTSSRPLLLMRTIKSVLNQTFTDFEHIIVDDDNDPETGNIVKGIEDRRIVFLQHHSPKGAAAGYNTGIKVSRGRFILFLDDDDEYLPSFLEKMYNRFSGADPNIGFIWAGISRILDSEAGEKVLYSKVWPSKFKTRESGVCEATSIGNGFGVCVRRECIDIIGLYDESLKIGEDTDFLFRLVRLFDFETIPEILVKIHQHGPTQLTDKRNYPVRLELRENILKRHSDLLNEFPRLYYLHYKAVAELCYSLRLKQKGRKTIFSIINKSPFHFLSYADLLFFELTGKDTSSFLHRSRLICIAHIFRK